MNRQAVLEVDQVSGRGFNVALREVFEKHHLQIVCLCAG